MIGETVSHFRITDRLGSGAMGDVYLAEDVNLPRQVALKFLSGAMTRDKRAVARFVREARAVSALDHPNVCTVYETGETDDGNMFIAMAYYEGGNIKTLLDNGPIPVEDAVAFAIGTADGLQKAHNKEILHRDVKPANLMMTKDGILKIVDFGIAKLGGVTKFTKTGMTLGTLAYMSPEQTRGSELDGRSDIFSLGVTLYEMLAGEVPFWAENEVALSYRIGNEDPKPIRQIRKDVPASLALVIEKSLEKDPEDRYSTMAELRDDLLKVLHEIAPTRAVRIESLFRTGARRVKSHARYAVAGVVIIAAIIGLAMYGSAMRCALGLCGLGNRKGIAVMAFEPGASEQEAEAFAEGLAYDLSERVERLAVYDPDLWVVPAGRVRGAAVRSPSRANDDFGVDAVVTGTVYADGGEIEVRLLDAKKGHTIRSLVLSANGSANPAESWQGDWNLELARLLEVDLDPAQLSRIGVGHSEEREAYRGFVMGLGYLASGSDDLIDSAIASFDNAIAGDSSFANAYAGRAEALFEKGSTTGEDRWVDEAVAACERAIQLDVGNAAAYEWLGRIQTSRGEKEEAIESFARAVELNPRGGEPWRLRAYAHVELGRHDEAEKLNRAAIDSNPRYFGGYEDLGYLMYVLGRYDEAVEQFERVAQLAPAHAPTYSYLGALYFHQEHWESAIANFEKSFELKKNFQACANLGLLYYMDEQFEDAARMYEWAREYRPNNHLVLGGLATSYLWIPGERERAGRLFEEAIKFAEERRKSKPNDAELLSKLAGWYSVDHPDTAVALAEEALRMAPDDSEVLYRAALVYEYIGQRARALVLLGDAIDRGYSQKMIAHERQFKKLREDPRYKLLVSQRERPDSE